MTGHLDADVLAEFREGLLGRRRSARIRAHLAGCSRCASLSSGLAEVTALLASAPVPRMPDELTARLDGVLAAESAARAQAGTSAAAAGSGAVPDSNGTAPDSNGAAREGAGDRTGRRRGPGSRPARSARPQRPWRATALRAASVTAAVLVIAGGGYGVSRLLHGGGGTTASSGAQSRPHLGPPNTLHATPAGGHAAPLPASGLSPGLLPVIHSGTDYLPGRLSAQAEAVLARYPAGAAVKTAAPASTPTAAVAACVQRVTGGFPPRLVDLARYQGRAATVIVQAAAGGRPGQVWVVGPGCSAGSRDLLTHALLTGAGTGTG